MRSRRPAWALLAGITVALGACAANHRAPAPNSADADAPPAPADDVRIQPVIAPVERFGLEIAWWVAADPDRALGASLRALASPDQRFDPETLERLRAHGLRPVRLTESALFELTSDAPPVGGIERLWIGMAPDWTPARLPAPADAAAPRAIPELDARTPPGALRLLWRAYLGAEDLEPVLRVDLIGQAISPDYARERFDATRSALPRPIDAGPAIASIRSTLVLRPGEVIVIVGEAPDADWDAPPTAPRAYDPDAPPPGAAFTPDAPAPEPLDAEDQPPIPEAPTPIITAPLPEPGPAPRRTFGELLLTPDVPGDAARTARLVLVVIPRIPDRVELIGSPRSER